jgi:hypothetical protein
MHAIYVRVDWTLCNDINEGYVHSGRNITDNGYVTGTYMVYAALLSIVT